MPTPALYTYIKWTPLHASCDSACSRNVLKSTISMSFLDLCTIHEGPIIISHSEIAETVFFYLELLDIALKKKLEKAESIKFRELVIKQVIINME